MNQIERKTLVAVRKAIHKAYGESKGRTVWLTVYANLEDGYKE